MGKKNNIQGFPGGLWLRLQASNARGMGLIPGAMWCSQKKKKKNDLVTVELYLA